MKFLRQSLISASAITIMANFLSKFFGYFREAINANYFGTSSVMDTFIIAFTVPEIVSSVVLMAVPPAIIPLLRNYGHNQSIDESSNFWTGFHLFFIIFLCLSAVVYLFRFQILDFLAPMSDPATANLAEKILIISIGVLFFRGLEVYFRSWLFAKKHFIIPALSNLVLNIVILLCVIILFDKLDIESLALGWFLGSFAIFVISGTYALKVVNPRFTLDISRGWINIALKSIFAVCAVEFMASLVLLIDRYLAANYLDAGELAGLRYAFIVITIPVQVIAASYNVASFPWITDLVNRQDLENIKALIKKSVSFLLYAMGYISIFFILFSSEIIMLAFQRGKFTDSSLNLTSSPLKYFAIGLLFHSLYIFFIRFYYAKRRLGRLAVIIALILVVKFAGSVVLMGPLGNSGLALATSIARIFGFIIIAVDLKRELNFTWQQLVSSSYFKIVGLLFFIAIYFLGARTYFPLNAGNNFLSGLIDLGLIFGSGAILYVALGYLINIEETRFIIRIIKNKIPVFKKKD